MICSYYSLNILKSWVKLDTSDINIWHLPLVDISSIININHVRGFWSLRVVNVTLSIFINHNDVIVSINGSFFFLCGTLIIFFINNVFINHITVTFTGFIGLFVDLVMTGHVFFLLQRL